MGNDCSQYLKINRIAAALQRNEPSILKEVLLCLETTYKQPFLNKILLPYLLAPRDKIIKIAEESYEQAVSVLLEHVRDADKAKQYDNVEQLLLGLFKSNYHKLLALLLKVPDATAQVSFTLLKTNIYYRDYFIWHYINNFTLGQISVITGKQANDVKSNLWATRENVRNWLLNMGGFSTEELISEQQYYHFLDYFTRETTIESSVPSEELIIDAPLSVQKNFELELFFRYQIDKALLQKNVSNKTSEPYLTAQEYLDHIKQIIISGQQNSER